MKVIIEIGNPSNEISGCDFLLSDNIKNQYEKYEDLLINSNNVRITDVDHFMLYIANNLILRYVVSQNEKTPIEIKELPNLNPDHVKVYEKYDDGTIIDLKQENGLIYDNYYDNLMGLVMNDFYRSINYLSPSYK